MNRRWLLLAAAPVAALGLLAACSDDETTGGGDGTDSGGGGSETSTPDGGGFDSSTADGSVTDGGADVTVTATTVAKFAPLFGELPEGIAVLRNDGGAGTPLVGFAPQGRIVSVLGDGGTAEFASFAGATGQTTLGMAVDANNNVYVAVADTSGGAGVPAAGIYRILASDPTHTPVLFSQPSTLPYGFLNGLDFIGTDLFFTDSTGTIFKSDSNGVTNVWLSALSAGGGPTELAGDEQDCKLGNGFPLGVNGITHDAANIYVVNTDKGTLLKIPRIAGDAGVGGAIVTVKKDAALCGADGLLLDKDGSFLVANNKKNKVQRVTAAGVISDYYNGAPLDGPASLWIDTQGTTRRLLVTNSAFGSYNTDGGKPVPSLVSLTLAP